MCMSVSVATNGLDSSIPLAYLKLDHQLQVSWQYNYYYYYYYHYYFIIIVVVVSFIIIIVIVIVIVIIIIIGYMVTAVMCPL